MNCMIYLRINIDFHLSNSLFDFQDYYLVFLDVDQQTENIVSAIYKTMNRVYIPALKECKAWGDINPPNPKSQDIIKSYISKVMLFIDYLASK